MKDFWLLMWVLYVTGATIGSWFNGSIENGVDFLASLFAWAVMVVIGLAIRGTD